MNLSDKIIGFNQKMCILFSTKIGKIHFKVKTLFITIFFYFVLRVIDYFLRNKAHKTIFTTLKILIFGRKFPNLSNFERISEPVLSKIHCNLCKKVVFGVNCWKYFLIALITFRSSSDKFVSGHFAFYKLIAETLTFRASNLFLEIPFFHDCSWTTSMSHFWSYFFSSMLTWLAQYCV